MRHKQKYSLGIKSKAGACLLLIFIFTKVILLSSHCANPNPPGGGPKDTIAPIFVGMNIPIETTEFQGKKVIIFFNENITIRDPKLIFVNPQDPDNKPQINFDQSRIFFEWKKPLKRNTTYSIKCLRGAIADINENNIYREQIYVPFSTGTTIDTSIVYGRVLDANTGRADSTMLAVLFTDQRDSAVVNQSPEYITTIDTIGRFAFWNIKPGIYRIYAMTDPSGSGRYVSGSQRFAFQNAPIHVDTSNVVVDLMYAFTTKEADAKNKPKANRDTLKYTCDLKNAKLSVLDSIKIQFNRMPKSIDTAKIILKRNEKKIKDIKLIGKYQVDSTYLLYLDYPITTDTATYTLILDSLFVKEEADFFKSAPDTFVFKMVDKSEYGSLKIIHNMEIKKDNNYLLNLRKGDKLMMTIPLTQQEITIDYVLAGEYTADILDDKNKNGKWDEGSFFGIKKQPEVSTALKEKLLILKEEQFTYEIDIELE